jgi:membrane-bound serine protease (ClpP class)
MLLAVVAITAALATAVGQEGGNRVKIGYLIDVPVPLESSAANRLLDQLTRLGESAPDGQRVTVVLRYSQDIGSGEETEFEDALKLARAMSAPELRRVRIVSLVEGEVTGHSTLPIISSDLLIVSSGGVISDASAGESSADETIALSYRSIAERRGLFPPAMVSALVDPGLELAQVSKVDGDQVFAAGDELTKLRASGDVLGEDVWSAAGVPLRLDAEQLRSARIAAQRVSSLDQTADALDLAELNPISDELVSGEAQGVLLEITGSIVAGRSRRWQSNLTSTLEAGDVNTWVITFDSGGGSLDSSATLAGWFAEPEPPLRTVAGLVRGEARGDAALVAISCKPLFMKPDSRLGGPGAEAITKEKLGRYEELIDQIALSTKRPAALIRGLLDPDLVVYRYTNRKTGRLRYATQQDIIDGALNAEDEDAEREKWQRGEQIELAGGLATKDAIALGLADGESRSLEDTSRRVGLSGTPPAVADRGLVRFVEKLGRSSTLAFLLLFIGFAALSAEANAPGLSVPGFIALICFGLYFWMKFLAGTAEWLELVAFSLGLICIAIEVFIVPGFGVFGIGGLALTVLGVILMSQTFVIPRNVYQVEILTRGVWVALGGAGGMVGGFIGIRMMLPHVPLLRGLVMEKPDHAVISESEKLGDYGHLLGQTGAATTPLRPSGKARFGDQVIQVISDGTAISTGDQVRVMEVHATKVVVELLENG